MSSDRTAVESKRSLRELFKEQKKLGGLPPKPKGEGDARST